MADDTYLADIGSTAELLKNKQTALNNAADTEYNAYVNYINQAKNNYSLGANAQKAGLYQAAQLQEQNLNNLYANAGLSKSGLSETSKVQQSLNLQNNIAAVNSEERAALKSLQDLITQEKATLSATKQGNEATYWDELVKATQAAQERQNTQRQYFASAAADASSLSDIDFLASFYSVDEPTKKTAKQLFANQLLAAGDTSLTTEDIKTIYGEESEQYKTATAQAQTNTYNTLSAELGTLFAKEQYSVDDSRAILDKADTACAVGELSTEDRGKLYAESIRKTVLTDISSTNDYDGAVYSIQNSEELTAPQKNELLTELKKSDYNPESFKGGKSVRTDSSVVAVRNNGKTVANSQAIELGQDFQVTINGSTYWVEAGNLQTWSGSGSRGKVFADTPIGGFCYYEGDLYYRESKAQVYLVKDVNGSAENQKVAALVEALQAESIK